MQIVEEHLTVVCHN